MKDNQFMDYLNKTEPTQVPADNAESERVYARVLQRARAEQLVAEKPRRTETADPVLKTDVTQTMLPTQRAGQHSGITWRKAVSVAAAIALLVGGGSLAAFFANRNPNTPDPQSASPNSTDVSSVIGSFSDLLRTAEQMPAVPNTDVTQALTYVEVDPTLPLQTTTVGQNFFLQFCVSVPDDYDGKYQTECGTQHFVTCGRYGDYIYSIDETFLADGSTSATLTLYDAYTPRSPLYYRLLDADGTPQRTDATGPDFDYGVYLFDTEEFSSFTSHECVQNSDGAERIHYTYQSGGGQLVYCQDYLTKTSEESLATDSSNPQAWVLDFVDNQLEYLLVRDTFHLESSVQTFYDFHYSTTVPDFIGNLMKDVLNISAQTTTPPDDTELGWSAWNGTPAMPQFLQDLQSNDRLAYADALIGLAGWESNDIVTAFADEDAVRSYFSGLHFADVKILGIHSPNVPEEIAPDRYRISLTIDQSNLESFPVGTSTWLYMEPGILQQENQTGSNTAVDVPPYYSTACSEAVQFLSIYQPTASISSPEEFRTVLCSAERPTLSLYELLYVPHWYRDGEYQLPTMHGGTYFPTDSLPVADASWAELQRIASEIFALGDNNWLKNDVPKSHPIDTYDAAERSTHAIPYVGAEIDYSGNSWVITLYADESRLLPMIAYEVAFDVVKPESGSIADATGAVLRSVTVRSMDQALFDIYSGITCTPYH